MKKKLWKVCLALVLGAAVTGCGNPSTSSQTQSATGTTTESQESQDTPPVEDTGETYTVTMVLHGTQQPDEERIENRINEILEPELNARLDMMVLPWGSAMQQKRLMLSSGEKIDVFYTGGNDAVQFLKAGQLIDMSDLIEKYGTNVKSIFGMDVLNGISQDGFIYGVPAQIERGSIPAIFMRKDIVEKYNIDTSAIKGPKDLEQVFEIVKAGEPTMNMLYSSNNSDMPLDRLKRYDDLADHLGVLMNQTESTTIENLFATDWYMENAMMLHDWYNKGYINKDAGIETENWRTVFKAGNLFSIIFHYHPGTPVEFNSSTGYEFTIVPFFENAIKNSTAYTGVIFSVAQNSDNPEKTMQVLDYIYGSQEVMNLFNWGEEGTDYVYTDQEKRIINYPEGVTTDTVGYSLNLGWELPNQFIADLWEGSDPDLWKNMEAFNSAAEDSLALGFLFDNTGYETQITALNNVIEQYKGPIASGSVNPQEYIPNFLNALDQAGINDIIEAKQTQLDAWLANK